MQILVTNKIAFFNELSRLQFEYNKRFENTHTTPQEKVLLENYLKTSNKYVLSFIEELVSTNPEFKIKLDILKNEIKIVDEAIHRSDLEIFKRLITSQSSDRTLKLYRGTSKLHFTATNIINNNPYLSFVDINIGDNVKPITCLSLSLNPFVSADFCCGGPIEYLLVEYVIVPDGLVYWAAPFSNFKESELILPPDTNFVVTKLEHMDLSFNDIHTNNDESINYIKLEMRR